jgi:similar to stage IV sporulation protein
MVVVRKGELLVSGVYDKPMDGGIRTTRAGGAVFARTTHEFTVEIPLEYEEKVYTGREWSEKTLKIFANTVKVFVNTGNVPPSCDIICYEDKLRFFNGKALPIGMCTKLYREYTYQTVTLDADAAMAYAFDSMEKKLMSLPWEAELLEKTFCYELTDEAYILNCRVICVQNIAVTQEIEI